MMRAPKNRKFFLYFSACCLLAAIPLFFAATSHNASSANPETNQQTQIGDMSNQAWYQIITQAGAVDGHLTKEMHHTFWEELGKDANPLAPWMAENLKYSYIFQKEMWQSALLSYQNQKVTRTAELEDISAKVKNHVVEELPFEKSSDEYKNFLKVYQAQTAASSDNEKRLLEAAAARTTFEAGPGRSLDMNEENINMILTGLDESFKRLNQLMNPKWTE